MHPDLSATAAGLERFGRTALAAVAVAHVIAAAIWGPATVLRVLGATLTGQPL